MKLNMKRMGWMVAMMTATVSMAITSPCQADSMWHIVSGGCHDEQSGEPAVIENYDFSHFGVFAAGHSPAGIDVLLAEHDRDQISLWLGAGRTDVRTYVKKLKSKPTEISLSLRIDIPGQASDGHWFSCDLKVGK